MSIVAKWLDGSRIRIPLGTEVGLSLGDIVLDGDPAPPPLKGHSLQFSAHVRCGQTVGRTKMPFGTEVGLGPGYFVLHGDPAPPEKKGTASTQFLVHVYCGQTAAWIKMPLGMELNLGPGDVVLDGVPAPHLKEAHPPVFGPRLLWPNSWTDEDATWYGLFSVDVYCGHLSYC